MKANMLPLCAAALVILGTAASQPGDFRLDVAGLETRAAASATVVRGDTIHLELGPHSVRGQANGRPVDLHWAPGSVSGAMDGQAVQLSVSRDDDRVEAQGSLEGMPSAFHVGPKSFEGDLGSCHYALEAAPGSYVGWRSCGPHPFVNASMQLPPVLAELPGEALVAVLVALLPAD